MSRCWKHWQGLRPSPVPPPANLEHLDAAVEANKFPVIDRPTTALFREPHDFGWHWRSRDSGLPVLKRLERWKHWQGLRPSPVAPKSLKSRGALVCLSLL